MTDDKGMRRYEGRYYSLMAPARSCFFCEDLTDIFWDYEHGPYLLICRYGHDTKEGACGRCERFREVRE